MDTLCWQEHKHKTKDNITLAIFTRAFKMQDFWGDVKAYEF